jgi:alpha-methylacyl-CoA racemase
MMRSGPLTSLRVVEMAGLGPGPLAGTLLADLGADVVRIASPSDAGAARHPLARGRPTLTADLKDPADRDGVLALIDRADVLLDVFRPGVLERLGIGPEVCLSRNAGLVFARLTGWGQDGPRAQEAGHDINYVSVTGVLHAVGEHGSRPVPPLNLVGDYGGGTMFALLGVLAALHERTGSGRGQVVDIAMSEGAAGLALYQHRMAGLGEWSDQRGSNSFDGGTPYYATYRCADGRYVAVGALEPRFFAALLDGLGLAGQFDQEPASFPAMRRRFEEVFRTRTREEWAEAFRGKDACVTPVLSLREASTDQQARARGSYLPGLGGVAEPGPAPRFLRTPASRPESARIRTLTVAEVLAGWPGAQE